MAVISSAEKSHVLVIYHLPREQTLDMTPPPLLQSTLTRTVLTYFYAGTCGEWRKNKRWLAYPKTIVAV